VLLIMTKPEPRASVRVHGVCHGLVIRGSRHAYLQHRVQRDAEAVDSLGIAPSDKTGSRNSTLAPVVGGALALFDGLLHIAVRMQHPELDRNMQAVVSEADESGENATVATALQWVPGSPSGCRFAMNAGLSDRCSVTPAFAVLTRTNRTTRPSQC
jgi:hypothetical protein